MHPLGQHALVQLADFFFYALEYHAWVFAFAHDDDARDHIVVLVLPDRAQSGQRTNADDGNVADQNRRAVFTADDNAANVIRRAQ